MFGNVVITLIQGKGVVIPTSLRLDMIKRIHSSHIGVEGCLGRARESLYWSGMNSQVKDFIRRCETCRIYEKKQQRKTLISQNTESSMVKVWNRSNEMSGQRLLSHNGLLLELLEDCI